MPIYRLTMSFQDEQAKHPSRFTTYLDAADEAAAIDQRDDIMPMVAAMSGSLVTAVELSRGLNDTDLLTLQVATALIGGARPLADHDNEKGLRFIWRTVGSDTTKTTIPAIRGIYVTPSGQADEGVTLVSDFITEMIGSDATDKDGENISDLVKAYKVFKDRGQD